MLRALRRANPNSSRLFLRWPAHGQVSSQALYMALRARELLRFSADLTLD
jgi:hypothetical protein